MWGLAVMGVRDPEVFSLLTEHLYSGLNSLSCQVVMGSHYGVHIKCTSVRN